MKSAHTPRRVVSLQPSATVILQAIGQLERLVACTRYCVDVCPEAARERTIVDDSWTAHADQIRAAQPELVIAAVPYQEKSIAEILKSGARFLGLAPRTLADIYMDIVAIAGIMGVPERGEAVVNAMQDEIQEIRKLAHDLPRRRVFCEEWGNPLIASQAWVAELVEAAGGEVIGAPGVETSMESVFSANPDVLIAAWCGAGDRVPMEKIMRARGWTSLRAVQERQVYCVRDELLNTPAPTLISGLRALAAAIHPERFPPVPGLRRITEVSREARTPDAPVV